jgi:hypothetical protein
MNKRGSRVGNEENILGKEEKKALCLPCTTVNKWSIKGDQV